MKKTVSLRKKIFILFFSVSLAISPVQATQAQAWDAIFGAMAKTMMDYLREMIMSIITGAMKEVAIKMVNEAITKVVGGDGSSGNMSSGGGSKIISNYKDYLYLKPQKSAEKYINDYISQTTGGQSLGNYIASEGIGDYFPSGSGGTNYLKTLSKNALKSVKRSVKGEIKATYLGDPGKNMFNNGDLKNFNLYLSGINNPWAYNAYIEDEFKRKIEEEKEIAQTKALAGLGYKGTESNGKVTTPGSFIASQMSNSASMNFDVITNANSIAEVAVGMVSSFVSQAIENGIGKVQEEIDKENTNEQNSEDSQTPGDQYGSSGGWVNPDTDKPF